MAFKPPVHLYAFKELRYRDKSTKATHLVKIVLPKQEDRWGRYLFEFQDGSGRREFLDHQEVRAKKAPLTESQWGS